MDIQRIIFKELKKKGEIRVADITEATGFSRAYISRFLKILKDDGKIALIGKANKAKYVLATTKSLKKAKKELLEFRRILKNTNLAEDIVLDELKQKTGILINLPKNVVDISEYAFTEMLNNAIEHSCSKKIQILARRGGKDLVFKIVDHGIGIFRNIMRKKGLKNELEAIQDLLKGKETTMPESHTGEGIFFTSKAVDVLTIKSSGKKLIFNNSIDDVFVTDIKPIVGTDVEFFISKNSKKALADIFRGYTDEKYEFSKTRVIVRLYKKGVSYVSRSQARRILGGLDKFKTITLDFKNMETVGQGFADEIFRVFQSHYPNISIEAINMNETVRFMVKRAEKQDRTA